MVRDSYVTFRRALNLMVINTTCTCKACRLLPTLDLKFFIHYGSYARQDVGDHRKLVGNPVNLIHRLLKNEVSDETGFEAYAAYTEPAVEQLKLDRTVEGFVSHVETYDDVGDVELCVKDMHGVWENARHKNRVRVPESEAVGVTEAEFPVSQEEMWSYITDPVTRNTLIQSDWQELQPRPGGGNDPGPGATYVCAHGDSKSLQTIVDWEPPKSYTVRTALPVPRVTALVTYELVPSDGGTILRQIWGHAQGPFLLRQFTDVIGFRMAKENFDKGTHALRQRVRQDQT